MTQTIQKIQQRQDFSADEQRKNLRAQRRIIDHKYDQHFNELYDKALKLYKSGSYVEAQKLLLQIDRMKPGYKRTAKYLKKVNAKIEKGMNKQAGRSVVRSRKAKTRGDVVGEALDNFEKRL